jgi:hypothetical protein
VAAQLPGIARLCSLMDITDPSKASRSERRSHCRYPITLQVRYKLLRNGRVCESGFGRTVNISSRGVLFETEKELPRKGRIDLSLNWPFLHQGSCGLKLVMSGRIVRKDQNSIAVNAQLREFRTAGRSFFDEPID